MADVKISALPAVTTCATTDIFALVQGGVTYRGTLAQMILAIPDADGSTRGLVTTGIQTIAGAKTFSSAPTFSTITAGSVLFAGTGGLVSQDNANLFWDDANNRLGIGTNTPNALLNINGSFTASGGNARGINLTTTLVAAANNDVLNAIEFTPTFNNGAFTGVINRGISSIVNSNVTYSGIFIRNLSNGTNAFSAISVANDVASAAFQITGSGNTVSGVTANQARFRTDVGIANGINFLTGLNSGAPIIFSPSDTERMRIFASTGNISINTTTDAGFRLDVNGTARCTSLTVTQSVNVTNNVSCTALNARQDQNLTISANWAASTQILIETITNKAQVLIVQPNAALTITTGTHLTQRIIHTFAPTSGTGSTGLLSLEATINQTGGASGITRGLYVNPTLTAAANWRSIETSNNTGYAAYFAGTANLFFNDETDLEFGTSTGTKIGTATGQKISLWNATPDIQPTTAITAAAFVANTSGIVDDTATYGGYTMGQVVAALKRLGALA